MVFLTNSRSSRRGKIDELNTKFTPELVLSAYAAGIFPMGDRDGSIRWYSPDPRCIFDLDNVHVPKRLSRTCRQRIFSCYINRNWRAVIQNCASREDTWITQPIINVYTSLHEMGFAHSVEAYKDGVLVGGLYGVAIGGAFFGESMFHDITDASKVSFVFLVEHLKEKGFVLLDSQYMTAHLRTFRAIQISRAEYLARLAAAISMNGCSFV
jgi:leucyl/phenylalanyl-tRNA--protein transferase